MGMHVFIFDLTEIIMIFLVTTITDHDIGVEVA